MADLFQRLSRLCLDKWRRLRKESLNGEDADLYAEAAKDYLVKYLRLCQRGSGGGDLSRQFDAYRRLGSLFYSIGDYQSACSHYNQALRLAERLHMERMQLHCLTFIANSQAFLGRNSEAIDTYKTAINFAMKIQADKSVEAQCLYRLGSALLLIGNYTEAIMYFLQHGRIAEEVGDIHGRIRSIDCLIKSYRFVFFILVFFFFDRPFAGKLAITLKRTNILI